MGGNLALASASFTSTGNISFAAYTGGNLTASNTGGTSVDITASGNIASTGSVDLEAARNLTVGNVTTGAGALALEADDDSTSGTGLLTINGNLSVGAGSLTLVSATDGSGNRNNLTLNGSDLTLQGGSVGNTAINGFDTLGILRDITGSGTFSLAANNNLTLSGNLALTTAAPASPA